RTVWMRKKNVIEELKRHREEIKVTSDELRQRMAQIVSQIDDADREHLIVSIRADRKTPMGVVADVKQALREASALRVHYAAEEAPLSSPGGDTNVLQQGNVSPSGDDRGASSGDEKGASQ
ncbi:MAG: hypothetical protein IJ527_09230, partial [Prevotella sp.]|nr:hypothetical protein [Prevotella sp.]